MANLPFTLKLKATVTRFSGLMLAVLFTFAMVSFASTASPVDTYEFNNEVTHKRYNALVKELRCPKCQNQNLADSNSPIAKDLRQQVYELLHSNKSDGEIVDFMVKRYGEFVLYRPRVSSITYFLWFGPFVLLILACGFAFYLLRSKSKKDQESAPLSDEQKQQLDEILGKKH